MTPAATHAGFARLADAAGARRLLQPQLAPLLGTGARIVDFTVMHAWQKTRARTYDPARTYLDVCYRVQLHTGATIVLHGRAHAGDGPAADSHDGAPWVRIEAPGGIVLRLRRFPVDPALPELARVIDAAGRIIAAPPAVLAILDATTAAAEVVAYRPGQRCTLRLRGAAGVDVYAKVYAAPGASVVAARLTALAAIDDGPDVPRLIDCDPQRSVLWLQGAAGEPLVDRLGARHTIAATARTLARLHRARIDGSLTPQLGRARLLHEADKKVAKLIAAGADWHGTAQHALAQCAERYATLPAAAPVVAHGDAHLAQILVTGERAVLLDLDELCRADAELDLSRLLVDLEFAPRPDAASATAATLLRAAYDDHAGRAADPALLDWYCALQRIDRMYRDFWRHGQVSDGTGPLPARPRRVTGASR